MITQLGKYRVDGVLGKGAMGVVYKAFDPWIERVVALKTIRKELLDDDQQAGLITRFKNEAQAAGRLNHPNIVTVYDYGEDSESAYIAMEFVEGTPLDELMTPDRPTALARVMAWMGDLLQGLDYAHSRGVVHRDIKPANLLITRTAQVKIGDFGVARIESSTLTQAGSMIGTPSYMSPEQFRGDNVDGRADLFSAGIVLYQLLTGARPFSGSPSIVMQQILNEQPRRPSEALPALGTRFDEVVARALSKAPAERFATARAFHEALIAAERASAGADADATTIGPGADDSDRTVLAAGLPAYDAGRVHLPPSNSGFGGSGGSNDSGAAAATTTPWKVEAFPEIEALLSRQIGPMAKFLLKKVAGKAEGLDQLAELLLPHIPSDVGRVQFQQGVALLKKKLASSGAGTGVQASTMGGRTSPGPTASGMGTASGAVRSAVRAPVRFDEAWADGVAAKLVAVIGPIARVVAKRAAKQTSDRDEFLQMLATHIDNPGERARFLAAAADS